MRTATSSKLNPPRHLQRKKIANDFQNKYRKEISDLISGTDYLDQILPNHHIDPKETHRDENISKNIERLTPDAKRRLMFQKPVTLVKRQANYYIAKKHNRIANNSPRTQRAQKNEWNEIAHPANKRGLVTKNNENSQQNSHYNDFNYEDENQHFVSESLYSEDEYIFEAPISDKHDDVAEEEEIIEKDEETIENEEETIEKDEETIENENSGRESSEHEENYANEIFYESASDENVSAEYNQSNDAYQNFQQYTKYLFNQNELESSDGSEDEPIQTNKRNQESKSKNNNQKEETDQRNNMFKMISSDAIDMIEAEVDFSSDSSSEFELNSQFFTQEKTVDNRRKSLLGENFISSGAIESFSDD
ncbi:hypothetical protein TRFO_22829 [Tritrichomonas foetus]|uniref:Uncharacterized protein n=1 Tax=Tritrichomonas foetus TaxID=1144522 RepID=A0A1J4KGW2_9EUKA|nr:hypothetical protein TRFO_22829 [Tritrichomonas foetus]|eukprot:OHT08573.1 hypothetical protein TRFO_22829 [Tritrichomonas foetus]